MPVPRLRPSAVVVRRAPRAALGRRRRNQAVQLDPPVPAAPPRGPRRVPGGDGGGSAMVLRPRRVAAREPRPALTGLPGCPPALVVRGSLVADFAQDVAAEVLGLRRAVWAPAFALVEAAGAGVRVEHPEGGVPESAVPEVGDGGPEQRRADARAGRGLGDV